MFGCLLHVCGEAGRETGGRGKEMEESSHTEPARKTREQGWTKVQVHGEDLWNRQSGEDRPNGGDKPSLASSGLLGAQMGRLGGI